MRFRQTMNDRKIKSMRRVAVLGAGAGGAAAVCELVAAGYEVSLWGRSADTLATFEQQGGIAYQGVLGEGLARPKTITQNFAAAIDAADVILVCLPSFAHADVATALAKIGTITPVLLNPGHTGGALEFRQVFRSRGALMPPIGELSTLTHVARKYTAGCVTITGKAKCVRIAALPDGQAAADAGQALFAGAKPVPNVLVSDLANVNMILHTPGAVLAAAWVEATAGDFTFYVKGMTPAVARVMRALDDERRAVARVFGHDLPSLIAEMQEIGTIPDSVHDPSDFASAIASGEANRRIRAPESLQHRYYREDFGYGLLPLTVFAGMAGVEVPVAAALLRIGESMLGTDVLARGRTAEAMGIAGLDRSGLLELVREEHHAR
jgi:opine dehydrogenase